MKKLVTLAFAVMMAFSAVCFAAGDGSVLNKDQKVAETMIGMFNPTPTAYAAVVKGFHADAAKNFTEDVFKQVGKAAAEKFGTMKSNQFVAFERAPEVDVVVYRAEFSKEKMVNLAFIFDKTGKMLNFQFSPLKVQAPAGK